MIVNVFLDKSDRLCIIDPKSLQAPPELFFFPIACQNEGLVISSASSASSAVQSANLVLQWAEVRRQKGHDVHDVDTIEIRKIQSLITE